MVKRQYEMCDESSIKLGSLDGEHCFSACHCCQDNVVVNLMSRKSSFGTLGSAVNLSGGTLLLLQSLR